MAIRKSFLLTLFLVLLSILIFLIGCSGTAEVVEALANDNATVCIEPGGLLGDAKIYRTNIASGTAVCNKEGMTVNSNTGGIEK